MFLKAVFLLASISASVGSTSTTTTTEIFVPQFVDVDEVPEKRCEDRSPPKIVMQTAHRFRRAIPETLASMTEAPTESYSTKGHPGGGGYPTIKKRLE
jgi:hypothetical protein